jgi:SAM-dependent methyltransferase
MSERSTLGLQKVCDIHDFFHPEIDAILREGLESVPFGSRRAWEFAMIFRALQQKGKLHDKADGLAMGAGTERLIYSIARIARKTTVTDLYLPNSGWVGVRTTDPKALVMSKAPWAVDAARIDAMAMDMRELKFADESFDFCWSTGAIEHIGEDADFSRHLAEVHRVLRPGGVYAFTTAVVFGPQTLRIPHNYYFNPEHLIDLLHASPLHAEPKFDCRVTDHLFNRPHIERFQDYGFPAGSQISKPVVSFRRGALLTANVMVLTKDAARPKKRPVVVGFDAACRQLRRHADNFVTHLWKEPQQLRAEAERDNLVVQPQYFGAGKIEIDVLLGANAPHELHLAVKSRAVEDHSGWKVDRRATLTRDTDYRLALDTVDGRVYSLSIDGVPPEQADRVVIRAKRLNGAAPDSAASNASETSSKRSLRARLSLLRKALS